MNPITFIIGIAFIASLSFENNANFPINHNLVHSTMIQQDSTPPSRRVRVKELTLPSKKKSKPAKVKSTKNRSEKIADVTKTKAWKEEQKKKVREEKAAKKTNDKIVKTQQDSTPKKKNTTTANAKKKNSNGLSMEEELKLLAKTEDINEPDKIHPDHHNNCKFAFDIVDEFTGVQKKGLAPRPFFNYTPDEYRKFIKEGDFIRCEGFLSQSSSGNMALNINLYVASSEAKYKFGAIKPNSAMVLHPMKGKEFFLMTYKGAQPQVVDNTTFYQCSFAINKSDLKNLKKTEIDQVKITFEKGFQAYDVFYLDFMIDQFPCFE